MVKYVKTEALLSAFVEAGQASKRYKLGDFWELNGVEIREVMDSMPAADVEEVRHGKWIKKYRGNYLCSECGAWFTTTDEYGNIIDGEMRAKYCEECGAKMDGEEE